MKKQQINKYAFNNFKAFGERMQMFSHKPITLVYGPNSIGKSSFLHSQLYFRFMQTAYNPVMDLDKTNFAGDTLDLGNFSNYIHQHDTNREMNFELNISNPEDINKLLTQNYSKIVELDKKGIIDKLLDQEILSDLLQQEDEKLYLSLENRLNDIKQINHIKFIKTRTQDTDLETLSNSKNNDIDNFEEIKKLYIKQRENNFFNYLEKIATTKEIENKDFIIERMDYFFENFNTSIAQLQDNNDDMMMMLKLTGESSLELITAQLNFFKYVCSLDTVRLIVTLKLTESKIIQSYKYYIDNDLLFEYQDDNATLNKKHKLIKVIESKIKKFGEFYQRETNTDLKEELLNYGNVFLPKSVLKMIDEPIEKFQNKYNKTIELLYVNNTTINPVFDNIYFNSIRFLNKKERKTQYFGPLRFYPNREDLQLEVQDCAENKSNLKKENKNALSIAEILKNKDSLFWKKPLIFINPRFLKLLLKTEIYYDALNNILPSSMKLTPTNIYTSQQVWANLINSKELQSKLNFWFANDSRLKNQYKVIVKESSIKFNPFIGIFRKIFSRKKMIKKELVFIDLKNNTEVVPKDMGLGISQIIPIILSSIDSSNTDIFIEQPELHLHPAIQSEIADEFIRSTKENNNEFIIETHSEHLLLRIMRRMRYTADDKLDRDKTLDLTPDDVCLLYVDNDGESTYIKELRLSKKGTLLDHWPNGFFEDGYKERFS